MPQDTLTKSLRVTHHQNHGGNEEHHAQDERHELQASIRAAPANSTESALPPPHRHSALNIARLSALPVCARVTDQSPSPPAPAETAWQGRVRTHVSSESCGASVRDIQVLRRGQRVRNHDGHAIACLSL